MYQENYTKAVFLTLKNKMALLKSFVQSTRIPDYKKKLVAISEEFKNKIDDATFRFSSLGEKFVETIEEINNNFNTEFKKHAQSLIDEPFNDFEAHLLGYITPRQPHSEEKDAEYFSYDKEKFSKNHQWFHDCQKPIFSAFNQIKSHIKLMMDFIQNDAKIDDLNKKISLLETIINDIPKLGLNEFELTTISGSMKKTLKQSKEINTNIQSAQNLTIEEISDFDFSKLQQKFNVERINRPKSMSNPVRKNQITEFTGHSQNHEEYEKILHACDYISEELAEIKDNQFNLESLMSNFIKKDEILAKFKENISVISENAGPPVNPEIAGKEDDWPKAAPGWNYDKPKSASGWHKDKPAKSGWRNGYWVYGDDDPWQDKSICRTHALRKKKLRKIPDMFDLEYYPELGDPLNWTPEYLAEEIVFCDVLMTRKIARDVCFMAFTMHENVYDWIDLESWAQYLEISGENYKKEYIRDMKIIKAGPENEDLRSLFKRYNEVLGIVDTPVDIKITERLIQNTEEMVEKAKKMHEKPAPIIKHRW